MPPPEKRKLGKVCVCFYVCVCVCGGGGGGLTDKVVELLVLRVNKNNTLTVHACTHVHYKIHGTTTSFLNSC